MVTIPLFTGVYFAYRYYTKNSLDHLRDQESSEPLNDMEERKNSPVKTTDLPWWNWRRWTGEGEPSDYFPLRERSPHGHGRQRERNE